jgi:hypothetical protein
VAAKRISSEAEVVLVFEGALARSDLNIFCRIMDFRLKFLTTALELRTAVKIEATRS